MHRRAMNDTDPHETHTRPVLACLGVSSRFRLVRALAVADRCVGELAEAVGLSQSCTTRHLQALERVGLVKGHREGRRVRFRLRADAPGIGDLLGWALSGAGLEALSADGSMHRNRSAAAGIPPVADGWPRQDDSARPEGETGQAPRESPESGVPPDQIVSEVAEIQAVAGPRPTRRPDELEDYLL
jgi:DNA-binding transcriptional ArsR family regulator